MEQKQKADQKIPLGWFIGLMILIIVIWGASGYIIHNIDPGTRGTFGDMFGAVNSLFSGLAFATLIYTIYLQTHAIKLQQIELEETREELRGQKEYLGAQNEVLKTQNFENTFFQLLKLLNEITDAVYISRTTNKNIHGKQSFEILYTKLSDRRNKVIEEGVGNKTKDEVIVEVCNYIFQLYQDDFGHYFRTLYNIIKLVKESNVSNKKFYTNLVRAQLSNIEVQILFYDCLSDLGSKKFKPLIEEFALLKVIRQENLLDPYYFNMYENSAFN